MWFALSAICFSVAVVTHAAVARWRPEGGRVFQFVVSGALGASLLWALYRIADVPSIERLVGLIAYGFNCELYIFLFTLVASSVSVSILVARAAGRESGVTLQPNEMVERRLAMLVSRGFLRRDGEMYELAEKGRTIVAWHGRLRRFFRHERK